MTAFFLLALRRAASSFPLLAIILIVIVSPSVRAQSEFGEAHALLEQLSRTQQEKRDPSNAQKLAELMNSVPQRVQQLLSKAIVQSLSTPIHHTADEIHRKLTAALQVAPFDQAGPEVFVFPFHSGRRDAYLIAYSVVYCVSCSRGWIGVLGRANNGPYQILSSDDDAFPNQTLVAAMLQPTGEGEPRFLIHGTNWGDAHNRLNVVGYTFDGTRLTIIWSRMGLPQGSIKVTPARITLSFLTSLRPPWSEKTEIYGILPGEIKLQRSSEHPDP